MILLAALVLGLLAGYGSALWRRSAYRAPEFRATWLAPAAFTPQLLVAYWPGSVEAVPGWLQSLALPFSLAVFLVFVLLNRRLPGMYVLLVGLILNMAVISANGGWMPISPDTAGQLPGAMASETGALGERVGNKDVLLREEDTRLEFLADRYLLPEIAGYAAAFSLGDVFAAAGAFWLLASASAMPTIDRRQDA